MERSYDVVIVGAGPAGGAAAYHCAAAGLSTLLVDRKPFPRSKVCGDGLTPRALRALARMNLASLADESPRIRGIRFAPGPETAELRFAHESAPFDFGVVIPRLRLDDRIRRAAEATGAEFQDTAQATELFSAESGAISGVWVQTVSGRDLCTARATILADGANGRLSQTLRGDRRASAPFRGVALRQYVSGIEDLAPYFEVHALPRTRGPMLEGYAWVFPVAPGLANVGVGILTQSASGRATPFATVFAEFLDGLARTGARFAHATPAGPLEGGLLATSMMDPLVLPPGVLCVGDAAGLVNPFTGEGIAYALESGELAAQAVVRTFHAFSSVAVSSAYARSLVTEYARLWRLRASPRHLGWLLSSSLPHHKRHDPAQVFGALREVALDQARVRTTDSLNFWICPDEPTQAFLAEIRQRIGARLRRTDALLAELGRALCSEDSPALLPLVVASQLGDTRTLQEPTVRRGLLAIALFSLAASVLGETRDAPGRDADQDNTLAITVGDCLITEATAVAARLPQAIYERITTACLSASRAQLLAASRTTGGKSLDIFYEALGAPTVAAASLVIMASPETRPCRRGMVDCVRWWGRTSQALLHFLRDPSADLADYVRAAIDSGRAREESVPPPLQTLLRRLHEAARKALGVSVAMDQPA